MEQRQNVPTIKVAVSSIVVILVVVLGYGSYKYFQLNKQFVSASSTVLKLSDELARTEAEKEDLRDELRFQERRVDELQELVEEVTGTVGELEKLSQMDTELLQKYSKVFFLNEHYIPKKLANINSDFVYDKNAKLQILKEVRPFLEDMIEDAKDEGVDLYVKSAYRSFGTQASLKSGYTLTYGSGANAFSADQGYSEHQLGTTVDFTTKGLGGVLDGFEKTPEYKWLLKNGYRYGFIMSYPEGNAYYQYEPWHWRFVGRDLARFLHRKNKYFYDVEQRVIDEYLLEMFD
jgi:D-alanyl-D-alanine carboxypeptidase